MNTIFLLMMLAISALSLLLFFVVKKNIDHVTEGYIKIVGPQNKSLVKPGSLVVWEVLYVLAILCLPVVFYILTVSV